MRIEQLPDFVADQKFGIIDLEFSPFLLPFPVCSFGRGHFGHGFC
jgi:hypothetical protein